MNTKKNIVFNRTRFDKGLNYYGPLGINPQTSQLRIVIPFGAASQGKYDINVKKDPSLAHPLELLLKNSDLFVARAIGVALMVETTTGVKGSAPLYSYPVLDSLALPTGLKGFTDNSAFALYHGALTMKTAQSVNYSRFPLLPCLNIPTKQPFSIWNGLAEISGHIVPEFNLENVMIELPEEIVFSGAKTQPITIEFPASTVAVPANYAGYMVLIVEGWLYESGATQEFKVSANPYASML